MEKKVIFKFTFAIVDKKTTECLTRNPKVRGNCASCRVAAEWEECYG